MNIRREQLSSGNVVEESAAKTEGWGKWGRAGRELASLMGEELPEDGTYMPGIDLSRAEDAHNVQRGQAFCSRIITKRHNRATRYVATELYRNIIRHCYPEFEFKSLPYPRPFASPYRCFQCHDNFTGPPVFIPQSRQDGTRMEWGNFCSGPCANTYLQTTAHDVHTAERVAELFHYMREVHGFTGDSIGFAPSYRQLREYGGPLTRAQFRAFCAIPELQTRERNYPFIPTESVIEWQYSAPQRQLGDPAVTKADEDATGAAVLASFLGGEAPDTRHHHRWDVHGLRQPSLEDIERRMASLPKPEQREGLYQLYLERKGGFDDVSDDDTPPQAGKAGAAATKAAGKRAPAASKAASTTAGGAAAAVATSRAAVKPRVPAKKDDNDDDDEDSVDENNDNDDDDDDAEDDDEDDQDEDANSEEEEEDEEVDSDDTSGKNVQPARAPPPSKQQLTTTKRARAPAASAPASAKSKSVPQKRQRAVAAPAASRAVATQGAPPPSGGLTGFLRAMPGNKAAPPGKQAGK